MKLYRDFSLKPYNTFGIDVKCNYFTSIENSNDIHIFSSEELTVDTPSFILGGGSNILLTKDYEGLIIKSDVCFIDICQSDTDYVWVKAGAGVKWDDLVNFTLQHQLCGLENLISIPGTVGASAYQNIGAYGREAKDFIDEVEVYNLLTKERTLFSNVECSFGYRDSVFKQKQCSFDFIFAVTYKLSRKNDLMVTYGSIQNELHRTGNTSPLPLDIAHIIQKIRFEKLPDVNQLGSAGSFFKNPVISKEQHQTLLSQFPSMVSYPNTENSFKISAGWLIEYCGWKGKTYGNAGVYEKQALVLVNLGNCTGKEITQLAEKVQESVYNTFHINLEPEVIFL